MRSFCSEIPLLWDLFAARLLCCETSSLWDLFAVKPLCCEISLLWDLFAVKSLCCETSLPWDLFAVRSLCCETSLLWESLCCEISLLWDLFAVKISLLWNLFAVRSLCCEDLFAVRRLWLPKIYNTEVRLSNFLWPVFLLGPGQNTLLKKKKTFLLPSGKQPRKYRGFGLPRRKKWRYLWCFFASKAIKIGNTSSVWQFFWGQATPATATTAASTTAWSIRASPVREALQRAKTYNNCRASHAGDALWVGVVLGCQAQEFMLAEVLNRVL